MIRWGRRGICGCRCSIGWSMMTKTKYLLKRSSLMWSLIAIARFRCLIGRLWSNIVFNRRLH